MIYSSCISQNRPYTYSGPVLLVCFFLLICLAGNAQVNEPCGTSQVNNRLLEQDSSFRKNLELFEQKTLQFMNDRQAAGSFNKAGRVYTIPVVVHVIYLGEPIGTGNHA